MGKKKEDTIFDWETAIKDLDLSEMMKTGLKFYITNNKLDPKNDNELNKICEEFKKLRIGA